MNIRFDKGRIAFEGDEQHISRREVIRTPLEEVQGILKCKGCGGSPDIKDVDLKAGIFVCPFCGTANTLPNFGHTADGPHITSIRNTYYVNGDGAIKEHRHEDRDGAEISSAEDLLPHNILKSHLQDILDVFGFGRGKKR